MYRSILKVSMVAMVLGLSLAAAQRSEAHEHDFRTGVFQGNWCGMEATFDIQKKVGNTWKFRGTIYLPATKQLDVIEVVQFSDNSLRIVRFLSGQHAGKHQTMSFHRPETLLMYGSRTVNFRAQRGYGIGTNNLGHFHMPAQ